MSGTEAETVRTPARKRYGVNEIFYSLQGEGFWSGTPMVFLRFSGCNLCCPWCDTDFSASQLMTAADILADVTAIAGECRRVCITGGEPSLQLDAPLLAALHEAGYRVHLETNGTHRLPDGIDWITFSPKTDFVEGAAVRIDRADELKLVYTGQNPAPWLAFPADHFFLQPCSGENSIETVAYIVAHPQWRLSLQTHKLLGIR